MKRPLLLFVIEKYSTLPILNIDYFYKCVEFL